MNLISHLCTYISQQLRLFSHMARNEQTTEKMGTERPLHSCRKNYVDLASPVATHSKSFPSKLREATDEASDASCIVSNPRPAKTEVIILRSVRRSLTELAVAVLEEPGTCLTIQN